MRILHINLICGHGGIETLIAALIKEQRKMGMAADVYSFIDQGGGGTYDGICNTWFAGRDSLAQVLLRGKYDVVHVVTYAAASAAISLRKALYKSAVVVTSHGVGAYEESLQSDAVVAVSESVAKSIQEHYSQPVQVIHNGVDTGFFFPPCERSGEKPILAWVGRGSDPHKDVGGLFALANSGAVPQFRIVMVDGSAPGEEPANWLTPDCEIIRRKPWKEMPDFYRRVAASRGFVLSTSRTEACPMNVLEAQACGCPVIAPTVGGIPELVVHQSTGYLYQRADGLSGVLAGIEWLHSGSDYEDVSRAASELMAGKFGVDRMSCQYADLYERALKKHPPSTLNRMSRGIILLGLAAAGRRHSDPKQSQKQGSKP
jgi:glycosyltransferase involved in cell wall biosynthesis